ncbi:hypothetical protein ABD91_25685 [Lysinibacillus sphaericus]|uniref:hypothetical protein n=1 Tax=Lysinibacillus sphaericus TaxID=1421 RepID=UPI0018CEC171|nr:hypothetical protein [Lysinibacillus sphaericus]MBG9694135.1 hypothetical protein [Lysinibacillus sphaericus]
MKSILKTADNFIKNLFDSVFISNEKLSVMKEEEKNTLLLHYMIAYSLIIIATIGIYKLLTF